MHPLSYAGCACALTGVGRRACSKGVDLNRDFPDVLASPDGPLLATGAEQPESAAVMRWSSGTAFVGSASMHEARRSSCVAWAAL